MYYAKPILKNNKRRIYYLHVFYYFFNTTHNNKTYVFTIFQYDKLHAIIKSIASLQVFADKFVNYNIVQSSILSKAFRNRFHVIVQILKKTIKHTIVSTKTTQDALQLSIVRNPRRAIFLHEFLEHRRHILSKRVKVFSLRIFTKVHCNPMFSRFIVWIRITY